MHCQLLWFVKTQHIPSKQGACLWYAMDDFICMNINKLQGTQSKLELQNKKFFTTIFLKVAFSYFLTY